MVERVGLCAIAKNEGKYLLEWVKFHLRIGFDQIYIYDNDSTDDGMCNINHISMVSIKRWPTMTGVAPQDPAYNDFLHLYGNKFDWVMFLDIDEFLNLKDDDNVQSFTSRFHDADAVAVNWRMFGSSGHKTYEAAPVLQRFCKASPSHFAPNAHIKTIFRPAKVSAASVHSPSFLEGACFVDTRGRPLPTDGINILNHDISLDLAQVNHYFTKSEEEFLYKRARGRADIELGRTEKYRNAEEFHMYDVNSEDDISILRFSCKTS